MARPRYEHLKEIIRGHGRCAVAFSGGADSTLLARAAREVAGSELLLLFARSELIAESEARWAEAVAQGLGCRLTAVDIAPLADPAFAANPPGRCYLCKKNIYRTFLARCREQGVANLLDGTNLDDLGAERPGLAAVRELGVQTPLSAAGLGKGEIRALSRELGLPTWDKPSGSCLATRIPALTPVTGERLRQVEQGEAYLQGLGFSGCRLRLRGEGEAVIELMAGGIERLLAAVTLSQLQREFSLLGLGKIYLSLAERPGVFL